MSAVTDQAFTNPSHHVPDAKGLAKRIAALKAEAQAKGYYHIPLWEKAFRFAELIIPSFVAFYMLTFGGFIAFVGMLLLAINLTRNCYFGHDLLHNHWGPRDDPQPRFALTLMAFFGGFGAAWWTEKHELHHSFPNACKKDADGVLVPIDGDIDSAPYLVWDKLLAAYNDRLREKSAFKKIEWLMPRLQAPLFFPILAIGRVNWSYQSAQVAFREGKNLEGWLCVAHWVVGYALAGLLTPGPFWTGWLWFTVAQMIGGLILGTVFIVNHTGMEVYDAADARGFYDRQARSTRNTTSSPFHDWAAGGLNSQIEHHMFPTMRRYNLAKMRPATKQAMIECGYHYAECDNPTAIREVMDALKQAAKA